MKKGRVKVKRNRIKVATVGNTTSKAKVVGERKQGKQVFKVAEITKKVKGGFIGLNKQAAGDLKIKTNIPQDTVVVYKRLGEGCKNTTIRHELIEQHLMSYGKMKYKEAHKWSLKYENSNLNPKQILKEIRSKKK